MSLDFLSAVLPTTGPYCVFTLRNGKPFKQIFVDDLNNLLDTAANFSAQRLNVFHALASFDIEGAEGEKRTAENARYMRALFLDLDCGREWVEEKVVNDEIRPAHWKEKSFPSKRAAVEQLGDFLQKTGLDTLGTPWLVDSGGGVHVYFPLRDDAAIDVWRPVAVTMKRAAKVFGFPIDEKVTSDAARVLRTPGTKNWKYGEPKDVVLRQQGDIFSLEDIAGILGRHVTAPSVKPASTALMIPGKRPGGEMSVVAKALAGNSSTLFKNIMVRTAQGTGCKQLNHYVENASDDGMEPVWRAWLSIAKHCDDGDKAARILSNMHPYDYDRMQTKLAAIKGPYSCLAIESENEGGCAGCPHKGKITNPLQLGRVVHTVEEETVVHYAPKTETAEPEPPSMQYIRPTPPRGFAFGQNGGLYYNKPSEKHGEPPTPVMLTNYDFFMTRMFSDGPQYTAEFVAVKNNVFYSFGVPTDTMGAPKEITKVLAKNNVVAVGGAGCDAYLAAYVRACVSEASCSGKHVNVPPHLGWQYDDSFAVGDTVYSPKGRTHDYTYKSDRLENVIDATMPRGTLEGWREVFDMMIRKAATTPLMWGHVSSSLIGFAAPLMRFAPDGADAVTMHLCGKESGAGKTLASFLANSVWGNPKGMMVGNKTSETTMMQRAGMLHSIHLHVDEVTDKNRKSKGEWLPNFVYDFGHGAHKVKGSNTGNAEITQNCTWKSFSMISSNDPQLESMMGAREHTSFGEARRIIEWKLPANWKIKWNAEEHQILRKINDNYGVAGRKWVMWLQQHMDEAEEMYRWVEKHWREETNADDNERFWTSGIVAIITAAILLGPDHANILTVPVKQVFKFMHGLVKDMRSVIKSNLVSAIDILNAYTREYVGNFVMIDCSAAQKFNLSHLVQPAQRSKSAVRGRIEYEIAPGYTDYYIEIKLLKMHCASIGHSYLDFERELGNAPGVRVGAPVRKDLLSHTGGPTMRVLCLKITMETKDVEPPQVPVD